MKILSEIYKILISLEMLKMRLKSMRLNIKAKNKMHFLKCTSYFGYALRGGLQNLHFERQGLIRVIAIDIDDTALQPTPTN